MTTTPEPIKKSAVYVDTSAVQISTGREPRGRGSWAFGPERYTDCLSPEMFWHNGLYVDARRAAVAHFAAKGVDTVYVQS